MPDIVSTKCLLAYRVPRNITRKEWPRSYQESCAIWTIGKDTQEHDAGLEKVLQQIQAAGATLNQEKCQFCKSSLKFLGHLIDQTGIRPDPDKTSAIARCQPHKTYLTLDALWG